MSASVLLDSVILIDHFNAVDDATAYLRSVQTEAVVSVVTRAEVLVGFNSEAELMRGAALLDYFVCLPISRPVADRAADLRRENSWKLPDAFQAALAKEHDLTLSTRNTQDFDPDRDPFVSVPYLL
jgi:hypothetical protein